MRKEAIEGLTAKQIQNKYGIPELPTFVSDVEVPASTTLIRGKVGKNDFSRSDGAIQYYLEDVILSESFTNTRPLTR